jgi:hypothetical protein
MGQFGPNLAGMVSFQNYFVELHPPRGGATKGPKGEKSIKYLKIFFRTSDDSVMIFGVEH